MPDDCTRCGGERWVCEDHPDRPFEHDGCMGIGDPCPDCNHSNPPEMPPGFVPKFGPGGTYH